MSLTERELYQLKAAQDLPLYAEVFLKILDKAGSLVPLKLNRAQRFIHERLEAQLKEAGRIRALILKGRQQGSSTYVQARMRWNLKKRPGTRAYVIAHEQKGSDNMFVMAKRYHDEEPPDVRPSTGASNASELWFDKLDSRYSVATAGTKDVGRSGTAQFMHASEYAFWPNADTHWAGIGQTVPLADGTEIIVESTANGVRNDFYSRWKQAIHGQGGFIAIFVPWYWSEEYELPVPAGFTRTPEEDELVELYPELTDRKLAFRRAKIEDDFKGDTSQFEQEYPNNWQEAFINESRDTFIPGKLVQRARVCEALGNGPLVAACDPARYGDDRTAIVARSGRKVRAGKPYEKKSTMEVAGICARFIEKYQPAAFFIDTIGIGAGVYDRLVELGYGGQDDESQNIVIPVNFAESATDDEHYVNKRAECWGEMKVWLQSFPCSIPDNDEWLSDLTAPGYTYDSSGRLRLESKEQMRKRGEKSPDLGDALAMTFAEPVRPKVDTRRRMEPSDIMDEVIGW